VGFREWSHRDTRAASGHKADVHAADRVIIICDRLIFYYTSEIAWMDLCNGGFTRRTHRNTRAASGQQS
jgi:hypothetical protein